MADHTDEPMVRRIVAQIVYENQCDVREEQKGGLEKFASEVIRLFLEEEHGDG